MTTALIKSSRIHPTRLPIVSMVKRKVSELVTGPEIKIDTEEPVKRKSSRPLKAVDYTTDNVDKLANESEKLEKKEKKTKTEKIGSSGICGKEKG